MTEPSPAETPEEKPASLSPPRNLSIEIPAEGSSERHPMLSPKSPTNKRANSPGSVRGKLENLLKMIKKEEAINEKNEPQIAKLEEEKSQLEKELATSEQPPVLLEQQSQSNEEELNQKRQRLALLQNELILSQEAGVQLQKQFTEISEDYFKEIEVLSKSEKTIQGSTSDSKAQVEKLQNQKLQEENSLKALAERRAELEAKKSSLLQKIKTVHSKKEATQADQAKILSKESQSITTAQDQKRKNETSISELKAKINAKKEEIQKSRKEGTEQASQLKSQEQQERSQFNSVKNQNSELNKTIKKLEEDLKKKAKAISEGKEGEKKKEKKILDLQKSHAQFTKYVKEATEKNQQFEEKGEEKKAVEEKIPQEILGLQAKNLAIKKDILRVREKLQAEVAETKKLVPPATIDAMNKKITELIQSNEKYNDNLKLNEELTRQNKELDAKKEDLEWGVNPALLTFDEQKKKQDEKNSLLEAELILLTKKSTQTNTRLEEYSKSYPNFNPDRKKKNVEAPKEVVKANKEGSKKAAISEVKPAAPVVETKNKKNIVEINLNKTVSNVEAEIEPAEEPKEEKRKGKKKNPNNGEKVEEKVEAPVEPVKQVKHQSPPAKEDEAVATVVPSKKANKKKK